VLDGGLPLLECPPQAPCVHSHIDGILTPQVYSNGSCALGDEPPSLECLPLAPCVRSRTDGTLSH